jgi:hypothetical protein
VSARIWLVVAIAITPLLVYPIVSVAGGGPRFPARAECIQPAVEGRQVDVVWGRFDDSMEADALRERVVAVGFVGTEALPDGCGRWKVELDGVPSIEVAQEVQKEAASVDLRPTLELDSDG